MRQTERLMQSGIWRYAVWWSYRRFWLQVYPEDGGNGFLQHGGDLLRNYTASLAGRSSYSNSLSLEREICFNQTSGWIVACGHKGVSKWEGLRPYLGVATPGAVPTLIPNFPCRSTDWLQLWYVGVPRRTGVAMDVGLGAGGGRRRRGIMVLALN